MVNKPITVFEHDTLLVGEKGFGEPHFNALAKFNDAHGSKYFRIGYRKITFGAYVGVIQVGTRTIEILPKADVHTQQDELNKKRWQRALLAMLAKAGYIKINPTDKAHQHTTGRNLLEVYLFNFLTEVQRIVQLGQVKKYHRQQSNAKALKGRLLIDKQLQHNLVHKERFYTEHAVYNTNHTINGILKRAIKIITTTTVNPYLSVEFNKLMLHFDQIDLWEGNPAQLDNISLDRKSQHYAHALELASLIIKKYSPDQSAGRENILAILFDMNTLFERFVLRCFKDAAAEFAPYALQVSAKTEMPFWKDKKIIPDIIFTYQKDGKEQKLIIDTKWKVIQQDRPSDEDLRQMYAYNLQFGATKALLFYPKTSQENLGAAAFEPLAHQLLLEHSCELYFADIFKEDIVSTRFAAQLLKQQLGITD